MSETGNSDWLSNLLESPLVTGGDRFPARLVQEVKEHDCALASYFKWVWVADIKLRSKLTKTQRKGRAPDRGSINATFWSFGLGRRT
jgi:hypothetical protein